MIKYSYITLILGLLAAPLSGSTLSNAVEPHPEHMHLNSDSLIFKNGKEEYTFMVRQAQYPMSAVREGNQGAMIIKWTVKPDGTIDGTLLTDLGDDINESMASLINDLQGQFIVKDQAYTVYQTLFFSIQHDFYGAFKKGLEGFKNDFEFPWLEPVSIYVMSVVRSTQHISANGMSSSSAPPGSQPLSKVTS